MRFGIFFFIYDPGSAVTVSKFNHVSVPKQRGG